MGIVASIPQLHHLLHWGGDRHDEFVSYYFDEPAYLAYVEALISGRPRRNDPYTGFDDLAGPSESLFSIQFLPAYALAIPAKRLGMSAAQAFIALRTLSAVASALAIFWLFQILTGNPKAASLGTLVVLCLGPYASSVKPWNAFFVLQAAGFDFPFLRCYVPALPFPVFFVFCGAVSKAVLCTNLARAFAWTGIAACCFVVLLFSYLFLWTAAAAWLGCLLLISLVSSKNVRRPLALAAFGGAVALLPAIYYVLMILQRSPTMDAAQLLSNSRSLDFTHRSEFVAAGVLVVLAVLIRRRRIDGKGRIIPIILSFALLPFVVFNQQVITGYSLQPVHYEFYVAPYSVVVAIVLIAALLARETFSSGFSVRRGLIYWSVAILLLARTAGTTVIMSSRNVVTEGVRAEKVAVVKRMYQEVVSRNVDVRDPRPLLFFTDLDQADLAPSVGPYSVLWSPHMFVFSGVTATENKERLYRYLYFSGVNPENFKSIASINSYLSLALFGFERVSMPERARSKAILAEDVIQEQQQYSKFIETLDCKNAAAIRIDYLVTLSRSGPDLLNFDRCFQRYDGASFGGFTIWRVKPRGGL